MSKPQHSSGLMPVPAHLQKYIDQRDWLNELRDLFYPEFISVDAAELEHFGRDWTRVYTPDPLAVVFPRTTLEVSHFLKWCFDRDIAVVPSGGRTGLAGGAIAARKEIVLSLDRMRDIGPVNVLERTVRVQAGAITEAVHIAAKPQGLLWPVDFASKGSSTVGGNIATNAGGVRVIRYGLTRNWVLGLTVVLMDGRILELNGALEKNNTGIDLRHLFIGSEGILGVITEAVLKLEPLPPESDVMLLGVLDLPHVFKLFERVRQSGQALQAFELMSRDCLNVIREVRGLQVPLSPAAEYGVLIEVERPYTDEILESWLSAPGVVDGVMAQSPAEARQLWELREGVAETLSGMGILHKHDLSLPISRLEAFMSEWATRIPRDYAGFTPYVFGHIGDGNLHVNVMKPESMSVEAFRARCAEMDHDLFSYVQECQGSVSAEHGIGLNKRHLLKYTRTPDEIALMKAMKQVFDPKGLLNPGKIFE